MNVTRCLKILFYHIRKRSTALKRVYRSKKIFVYLLLIIIALTVFSWYTRETKNKERSVDYGYSNYEELFEDLQKGFIEDKSKGCELPLLDPFDREAMKFEKASPTGPACEGQDLVECYFDECFVSIQYREKLKDWICIYRDVYGHQRLGPQSKLGVHQKYKLMKSDLVEVSCFGATLLTPGSSPFWSGHKTGLRQVPKPNKPLHGRRLSVMMLAFKAMSKNGFIRKMPKTYKALKQMGAFVFNGYNVIGDGSLGAFFPILVGKTALEYFEYRMDFDTESLLFRQLSKMGYRTAHFEDSPFLEVFQQKYDLFKDQMTDHYVMPFIEEVFGASTERNKSFCMGDTPMYRMLLNLTHQFLQLSGNHFSFTFLGDITRDNFTMSSGADEDLASFLNYIQGDGKMKETVLFVMGDHGPSPSPLRETIQGKLEQRLPLMAMVIPERLKQMRPRAAAALKANTDLLITPFDVHTTLTDILGIGDHRNRYKVPGADSERGLTLLKPAGVQPLWCVCASWHPIPLTDHMYQEVAKMLLDYINKLLKEWGRFCKTRTLVHIEYVASQFSKERLWEYAEKMKHDHRTYSNYFQARIIVGPGRAIFEGSIRHIMNTNTYIFADAELMRIDPYADAKESECIRKDYPFLSKLCYCVNYTETNLRDTNKILKK